MSAVLTSPGLINTNRSTNRSPLLTLEYLHRRDQRRDLLASLDLHASYVGQFR